MLVSCKNLTKYQGEQCILDNEELYIENKDKIAVVGINGMGKSTLLKIVAGKTDYSGKIMYQKDMRINYLSQTPMYHLEDTIKDTVFKELSDVLEYEIKAMLGKMGIYDLDRTIGSLSGGQVKRVALAIALVKECDLLILDEPTNHLDLDMISYLESYLIKFNKALLIVTHDRYFLERVCDKIVEINKGHLYHYDANYSKYLEMKQQREAIALQSQRKRKLFLKKELEWVRAGVQARTTKSKDRLQRFEKLSAIEDIEEAKQIEMIHTMSRLGNKTIELEDIGHVYDNNKLFDHFSYVFKKHDRIGIMGHNGAGKTTLLNIIAGELKSTYGKVITGETVKFGYFKQGYEDMPFHKRVKDYIEDVARYYVVDGKQLSSGDMLERFLFDKKLQYTPISRLSGGQRRRLYLLKVLMQRPNVLLLDEPTNDLDIETLQILEDYLDDFAGIIITVSHDRYFLDRICDGLFVIDGKTIRYVNGGYSAFIEFEKPVQKETKKVYTRNRSAIKMTYQEKKEFETIEDVIMELEEEISNVDQEMNGLTDFKEISILTEKRDELLEKLDAKNERYLYLLELQEKINHQ